MIRKAITTDRPTSAVLTLVFDDFLAHVNRSLDAHVSGPETFNLPFRLISSRFDQDDWECLVKQAS